MQMGAVSVNTQMAINQIAADMVITNAFLSVIFAAAFVYLFERLYALFVLLAALLPSPPLPGRTDLSEEVVNPIEGGTTVDLLLPQIDQKLTEGGAGSGSVRS
jgi:hypothetical protein